MQIELKAFQQQLLELFTNSKERHQFLNSSGTEYATYKNIPGLPKKTVSVYAGLLTNTADGTMTSIFPAIRTFYGNEQWRNLLESYFTSYKQSHYRLNAIAENFSKYLAENQTENYWLPEIADYEYQELAAEENSIEIVSPDFTPLASQSEFVSHSPVVNSTFCLREYSFDVVEVTASILDGAAPALPPSREVTHVVFFRDPQTHRCRQLRLGSVARSVLLASSGHKSTYAQIMQTVLSEHQNSQSEAIEERLSEIIEVFSDFHAANLFTGNLKCA